MFRVDNAGGHIEWMLEDKTPATTVEMLRANGKELEHILKLFTASIVVHSPFGGEPESVNIDVPTIPVTKNECCWVGDLAKTIYANILIADDRVV